MNNPPEQTIRGQMAYKIQLKHFSNKKSFVNARSVFLECRKHKIAIPESVLEVITAKFEAEHEKYLARKQKYNQGKDPQQNIQVAVECLLNNEHQETAFEKYTELTGENLEFFAWRLRVERYLRHLFPYPSDLTLNGLLSCSRTVRKPSNSVVF